MLIKKEKRKRAEELTKKNFAKGRPTAHSDSKNHADSNNHVRIFMKEFYANPPEKNYATNITEVYYRDDTCSMKF